jgi:hypothetical protein
MAAGLGFKTFAVGEILSAANVNGYLMQGVLVFANATARDAAITSPQEGQFAFTKDNDSLWYYSGSAWVSSGATGDIEGVTAGVGISGGGTSGTVTVTNSMATAIDAKGDLIAGTGADTFDKLTVGANNTVLTADSSTATGLKWAAPAGGGKVLQVVQGTTTTATTVASTSFTDTTLTATITPSSATSKILIMFSQSSAWGRGEAAQGASVQLLRGATVVYSQDGNGGGFNSFFAEVGTLTNPKGWSVYFYANGTYLDTPSSTSALTYKTQGRCVDTANSGSARFQPNDGLSTMILMEIGA